MQLDLKKVRKIIDSALQEDIGKGDITSRLTIPEKAKLKASFVTRQNCVVSGLPVLEQIFLKEKGKVKFKAKVKDGTSVKKGSVLCTVEGNARAILAFERVALNILQYMCGISTVTKRFADEIKHTDAKILDTRKTTPNMRVLAKYAVLMGGGRNHRFCLDDGILIKDNHIAFSGDITKAVTNAKKNAPHGMRVEVECDTLEQFEKALKAGADIILLDNMSPALLKKAVKLNKKRAILEASGGINLETIRLVAETGVDYISVGALTHSAPSIDIGLDIK